MGKETPPLDDRARALEAVVSAIGKLNPEAQLRILQAAAVFLGIDVDLVTKREG